MESRIIFRPGQEVPPDDLNALQDGVQSSFDHIVADAISTDRRFTGFTVTKESATSLRVAVGRLYQDGKVFTALDEQVLPLGTYQPVANTRVLAVYAFGLEDDTNIQDRDFVVDTSTFPPMAEPRAVAIERLRFAQLGITAGVASVDPQVPAVPAGACLLATLLMTAAGVVDGSITRAFENGLPNLQDHEARLRGLDAWRIGAGAKIDTLTSEQASLRERTTGKAEAKDVYGLMANLARVNKLLQLPTANAPYDSDNFRDSSKIDQALTPVTTNYKLSTTFPAALFPDAQRNVAPLALFNAYDDAVYRSPDNLVLPKFTAVVAVEVAGYSGELNMSQFSATTTTIKKMTGYKTETRYA